MVRPHVVTHVMASVDGRLEGFAPDIGLYYELAGQLPHDAVLTGSGTMVAAAGDQGIDLAGEDEPAFDDRGEAIDGPLMVVVDSSGRLTRFDWLRAAGLWSDFLVWGSAATPESHRARLDRAGVAFESHGAERVDFAEALTALARDHGVERVRVDSGRGLNSVLLAAGLVDEVSLLVAPCLVGHGPTFLDAEGGATPIDLDLVSATPQPNGHVWLRYRLA